MKTSKELERKKAQWSARGSMCPICKKRFRDEDNCPHAISEVYADFDRRIFAARFEENQK